MNRHAPHASLAPLPAPPPQGSGHGDWLLIDAHLRVLGAGPRAVQWMAGDQRAITLQHGRLQLGTEQMALERAVQALLAPRAPSRLGLQLHRPGLPPLTLALYRGTPPSPSLWLHLVWPEQLQLDGALLASMFRLTGAELRVALSLAEGRSTSDTAEQLGVQDNTVRGHIKQLLAKTHTQRQVELTALLWRSAAVVTAHTAPHPPQPGVAPTADAKPYPDGSGQAEPGFRHCASTAGGR